MRNASACASSSPRRGANARRKTSSARKAGTNVSDAELLSWLQRELERAERQESELEASDAHPAALLLKRVEVIELRRKVTNLAGVRLRQPEGDPPG